MKRFLFLTFSLCAFLFSCTSSRVSEVNKEAGTKTVSITLASNPSAGYSWQCVIEDEDIISLASKKYEAKKTAPGMTGAGGYETFVFACRKEGQTHVVFTYCRPWEGGETDQVKAAVVNVDSALNGTMFF